MAVLQLDFFKDQEQCELELVKESLNKVRKGTYAKINEINKECLDLKSRLEIIEKNICKNEPLNAA